MAINRFTQYKEPERFNPLSFQEMSFAPMALRNREDALMDQKDVLLNQLNNITVHDKYQEEFLAEKARIEGGINDFVDRVGKKGVGDLETVGEFRNLRNDYNKSVSASGSIGKAHQLRKEMAIAEDNYRKHALTTAKQSGDDIERNLAIEREKFNQGLPNSLKDFNGNLPGFNPAYAPDKVSLSDKTLELSKLASEIRTENGDFNLEPLLDGDGNLVANMVVTNKDGTVSTSEAAKKMNAILKEQVYSPDSDLHKQMVYSGVEPEVFMARIDALTDLHDVTSTSNTRSYSGNLGTGGSGGGSGKTKPEDELASWNKLDTGLYKEALAKSPEAIRGLLKTEQDPRKLSTYNHLLQRAEQMRMIELDSPEVQAGVANNIQNGKYKAVFESLGIKSVADYKEFLNDPESHVTVLNSKKHGFSPVAGIDLELLDDAHSAGIEYRGELVKKLAFEGLDIGQNMPNLIADESYTLSTFNKAGQDLKKALSTGLDRTAIRNMVGVGKLHIAKEGTGGGIDPEYQRLGVTGEEGGLGEEFLQAMASGDMSVELTGVSTGGSAFDPAVDFVVETGTGKEKRRFHASMDLRPNDDMSSNILLEIRKNSGKQGRILADQIESNLNFADLPVTAPEFSTPGEAKTKAIIDKANLLNSRAGMYSQGEDGERAYNDWLFVKNERGADFTVEVNPDMSYTTYKHKDGQKQPMTFNDLHKSTLIKNKFIRGDAEKASANFDMMKGTFMFGLSQDIANINELNNGGASVYSDKSAFKEVFNDYINFQKQGRPTKQEVLDYGASLYDKIANLPVRTKVKEIAVH